jgi:hypothetical protein
MKTPHCWDTVLVQKLALLVLGLALALTFATVARAETLSDYQPRSLVDAEIALEQGQPERALSHLHRGRAILRDGRFRLQREAIACQAYVQLQDVEQAAQVCNEVVAYDTDEVITDGYDSPVR